MTPSKISSGRPRTQPTGDNHPGAECAAPADIPGYSRILLRTALACFAGIGLALSQGLAAGSAGFRAPEQPAASKQEYFPPSDLRGGWRSLGNADEIRRVAGMKQEKLDEAFALAEGSSANGGLLVLRKGWLVYERYFGRAGREALCNLASCGKSYTSIAVGILMGEHPDLFPNGLDQKVFTPAYLPAEAFPLSDPRRADIKLGQLLCFSAGIRGNNPCYVNGQQVQIDPVGPDGYQSMIDSVALGREEKTSGRQRISAKTLWCEPGEGYSYASSSAHLASMIVRQVSGMELENYLKTRIAEPCGWGRFSFGYKQYPAINHTPGGGGIAVRPTDVLRFGYLLLREGRWKNKQIVPAGYIRHCSRKSPYNPHYPYSLQFNVNTDGTILDLPRDTYYKQGSGGHVLWIVPSLDLVVWRLAGRGDQYDQANIGVPSPPELLKSAEARKGWKPTVTGRDTEHHIIRKVVESIIDTSPETANRVKASLRASPDQSLRLRLSLASPALPERAVFAGVPLPPGKLQEAERFRVEADHIPITAQVNVGSRWPDQSIRWLLTRFQCPPETSELDLRLESASPAAPNPFRITETPQELAVDNGLIQLRFHKQGFALFNEVGDGRSVTWTGKAKPEDVCITDGDGTAYVLGPPDRLEAEDRGPVETVVLAEGSFRSGAGTNCFRYRARYFIAARSPLVRVQLTFVNDALDRDFRPLTGIACKLPVAGDGPLQGQLPSGKQVRIERPGEEAVRQVTDHTVRVTSQGVSTEREDRCPGWAVAERGPVRLAFAFRDFWETWPKGLSLEPGGIRIDVLPALATNEYAPRDLQDWLKHSYWFSKGKYLFKRGMGLRVEFHVRFGHTSEPAPAGGWTEWARAVATAPYAAPDPEHCCSSGAFGPVVPAADTANTSYETMVARAAASMLRTREQDGEYGWMNFGDWYGERRFNWGNNEYDWPWAMAVHFARSGRWEYLRSGETMARHSITIDTVRIPWAERMAGRTYIHCVGHVGMGAEPPAFESHNPAWEKFLAGSRGFVKGGIDTSGHIFEEGRFTMYFLTGDRDMIEAAEASVTAQAQYLAPDFDFHIERGAGWPLINAVAAYEATGKPAYLQAARLYIAKVLEKQDPQNGGWMLPQDPKECKHPPPHLGGKPFAAGVLLYGMMRYDLIEPRPEVKRSIVRACEWLVEQGWNAGKGGFRYKTGCPDYADSADGGGCMALCSPGLAYGWKLSGDRRFADILAKGFQTMCEREGELGKGKTVLIRQSGFALPVLQEIQRAVPDNNLSK